MKKCIWFVILFQVIILLGCGKTTMTEENGSIYYAVGKDIVIYLEDVERGAEPYVLAGELTKEKAMEKVAETMMEREVMFQTATEAGYTTTDEEVTEYLDEVKQWLGEHVQEHLDILIQAYGSEEAYWDYEYELYHKFLPIMEYRDAVTAEYNSKRLKAGETPNGDEYYQQLVDGLVAEQQFEIVYKGK